MYLSWLVLAILQSALASEHLRFDIDPRTLPVYNVHRVPGYRACPGSKHAKRAAPPELGVGGLSVDIDRQEQPKLERRAANGSIIALGSASNTYVVPIGLGTPGIAYPLQLDTGSSDLLLASSGCGDNCPDSSESNPYYDLRYYSSSFTAVGNNDTLWRSSFSDGSVASGFVARERVRISTVSIDSQVFGLMNATNLTLSDQQISGILGLGFPRLSMISRILLNDDAARRATAQVQSFAPATMNGGPGTVSFSDAGAPSPSPTSDAAQNSDGFTSAHQRRQASTMTLSSSNASASASVTPAAAAPSSAYLPPVLESLVTNALVPFPAFGLALSPPLNTSFPPPDPASKGAVSRYSLRHGSLTLGGVSEYYVSSNVTSGRTINDIEWHPVVPFAPLNTTASGLPSSDLKLSPTGTAGVPLTAAELDSEGYLYWALQMTNVAINNTAMPVNSTYSGLGIPSIAAIDAGSNGIYGPEQDVAQIFRSLKDARQVATGQWALPCNTQATLGFSFGGKYITLQPSDWMYAAVAGSSFCLAWPVAVPQTGDGVDWTLGAPFLRSTYTVFSYGTNQGQAPQVGFLPLQDAAPVPAGSSAPVSVIPAAMTLTVATVLPNQLITGPNYPVPTYMFNTPGPQSGAPQSMGLAPPSAYSLTALPVITLPSPVLSVNATSVPDVPGWPGDSAEHAKNGAERAGISVAVLLATVLAVL
ncbi:hypothetical protein CspeluHIS016_0309310 [Cutaneotrichosporon spelunceum]|uniref:Peptidase A1 domain-containing protein n=1 Tax=Cutaneotrichosporon spelunceum TaxID=1672016 RepID=A0AAD3TV41_9TREE|nr:hypothetical protein CspeluHIS016_0309310 [Cutaneotrichosporon spelunceum]